MAVLPEVLEFTYSEIRYPKLHISKSSLEGEKKITKKNLPGCGCYPFHVCLYYVWPIFTLYDVFTDFLNLRFSVVTNSSFTVIHLGFTLSLWLLP